MPEVVEDPTAQDPVLELVTAVGTADPNAIAMAVDGSMGFLVLVGVAMVLPLLDKIPARSKNRVVRFVRRHRVRIRKSVPLVIVVVAGLLRGVLAFAIGADPIVATVRGVGAGLFAIGANEVRQARGKMLAAAVSDEAPSNGTGR